jgi:hypothetical protein
MGMIIRQRTSGCSSQQSHFASPDSDHAGEMPNRRRVDRTLRPSITNHPRHHPVAALWARKGAWRGSERHLAPTISERTSSVGAACERMSQSGRKRRELSALLQHEKSNVIALICATTKGHTVVCGLYGAGHCLP